MLIKHEHVLTNDDKFSGLLSAYSSTHGPSPYFPQQSYFSFRAASPNPSLVSLLWLGFQIFDEDSTTVQHHYHPGLGIIYSVYNSPYIQGRLSSCSTSATTTTCPYTLYLQQIQCSSPINDPFHDLRTHDEIFTAQACFLRFLFGSGLIISRCVSYSTYTLAFLFDDCTRQTLCQDNNHDWNRVLLDFFLFHGRPMDFGSAFTTQQTWR